MRLVSDLHIHGKYSRATSKQLTIPNLEKYARIKGLDLMGTGDFTHPKWIEHLKEELTMQDNGILKTKTGFPFVLQTELSLIYSQGGRGRRVHNVVLAPDLEVVQQITDYLLSKGRIDYDGRPIFKIPCPEFVESLRKISEKIEVIPAHIWTPWFGMLGSKSGFDTVQECFGDQTKYINALETGLSSDPPMNWRLSQLDKYNLISTSDLHSFWPWRIGREATVFDIDLSYDNLLKALRTGEGLKSTIEVDPNYGKYHADGHRNCGIWMTPEQSKKHNGICPKCGNPITIGVWTRVEELADRPEGFKLEGAPGYKDLIPLSEILSLVLGKAVATQTVWKEYNKIVNPEQGRTELDILLKLPLEKLKEVTSPRIAELIIKNRNQEITIAPGYDGEYGKPLLEGGEIKQPDLPEPKAKQMGLGDFK
jgi:uncharacterized protein (TIGR00375 family)